MHAPHLQAYSPSPILIKSVPPIKAPADGPKHRYDGCAISDFIPGPILGTGSFGRVFLAHHKHMGDICAIKALSKAHLVKNQQASQAPHEGHASQVLYELHKLGWSRDVYIINAVMMVHHMPGLVWLLRYKHGM